MCLIPCLLAGNDVVKTFSFLILFAQALWRDIQHTTEARMTDYATPNLPSRDFEKTQRFYSSFGFTTTYVDDGWLIMARGTITLEFFLHTDVDPLTSWFSCCLRVDNAGDFFDALIAAGIGQDDTAHPRIHLPTMQPSGLRMGAMIDIDGTLVRVIENEK